MRGATILANQNLARTFDNEQREETQRCHPKQVLFFSYTKLPFRLIEILIRV